MISFWEKAIELEQNAESFVVVTVAGARGHTPQDPGAKAIVTAQGIVWGTVGGGKVEARAIKESILLIEKQVRDPQLVTWNLQSDIGMTCGGEITYLFEVHNQNSWPIAVFGAGHVSQAFIRILSFLPCQITCIDDRKEWLEKLPDSPNLKKIFSADPASLVDTLNSSSYFVVMTQGHAKDLPILKRIFEFFKEPIFVGGIGSDIKAIKLRKDLKAFGFSDQIIENFHCPIGLEFGSNNPYEIAISICAQLLQKRDLRAIPQSRE